MVGQNTQVITLGGLKMLMWDSRPFGCPLDSKLDGSLL
jgi:hypothetical protein